MSYEITGNIHKIFDTVFVNEKFKKRSVILKTVSGDYTDLVNLEFMQDKVDILDTFRVNQEVTITFSLGGREWKDKQGEVKYFTSLKAFYIKALSQSNGQENPQPLGTLNVGEKLPPTMPEMDEETQEEIPF